MLLIMYVCIYVCMHACMYVCKATPLGNLNLIYSRSGGQLCNYYSYMLLLDEVLIWQISFIKVIAKGLTMYTNISLLTNMNIQGPWCGNILLTVKNNQPKGDTSVFHSKVEMWFLASVCKREVIYWCWLFKSIASHIIYSQLCLIWSIARVTTIMK